MVKWGRGRIEDQSLPVRAALVLELEKVADADLALLVDEVFALRESAIVVLRALDRLAYPHSSGRLSPNETSTWDEQEEEHLEGRTEGGE